MICFYSKKIKQTSPPLNRDETATTRVTKIDKYSFVSYFANIDYIQYHWGYCSKTVFVRLRSKYFIQFFFSLVNSKKTETSVDAV